MSAVSLDVDRVMAEALVSAEYLSATGGDAGAVRALVACRLMIRALTEEVKRLTPPPLVDTCDEVPPGEPVPEEPLAA